MSAPVTLTFRHLPRSGELESSARDFGQRLQKLYSSITACHIVIQGSDGAPGVDAPYQVKIQISVPGAQIHAESAHADAKSPLHSAYENAKRQLEKLRRLQG